MVSPFHIVLALGQQEHEMNAKVHLSSRQASNIKDMYLGACSNWKSKDHAAIYSIWRILRKIY